MLLQSWSTEFRWPPRTDFIYLPSRPPLTFLHIKCSSVQIRSSKTNNHGRSFKSVRDVDCPSSKMRSPDGRVVFVREGLGVPIQNVFAVRLFRLFAKCSKMDK